VSGLTYGGGCEQSNSAEIKGKKKLVIRIFLEQFEGVPDFLEVALAVRDVSIASYERQAG
jgi:hypothetical protein